MRKSIVAAAIGVGLVLTGPAQLALGSMPASAQGHGGGGFHGGGGGFHGSGGFGGGFHGGGGFGGGFRNGGDHGFGGGYRGGWGGHGGYYGGYRGGYYGGYRGGYYSGIGFGYGCCSYYGGYYDGAGLLLGAAAVAGVTALAVDSAYDRSYYAPPPPVSYYEAPVVPAGYYDRPVSFDRRTLIDRCARAAEDDARGWASASHFVHVDTFDRDAAVARIEGTLDVTVTQEHGRYDRDGFPVREDRTVAPTYVHFTCQIDGGTVVAMHIDRPGERTER